MTTSSSVFAGKTCQPLSSRSFPTARIGLALATSLLLATSAQAATTDTWSGGSVDWNTGSNWSGGVPSGGSDATFVSTGNTGVTLSAPGLASGIVFTGTSAFTIGTTSGPAIVLTTAGTSSSSSTASQAINAPLIIGATASPATYTISNTATSASNVLAIGGTVTGAASSGNTALTLGGTNAGNNVISGVIGNGLAGGTLSIAKTGAGTWTLSGNNTYSGGTTVTGTLNINAAGTGSTNSAIGTGLLTIGNSTLLDNTSAGDITLGTANAISISTTAFTFGGTHNLNLGTGNVTATQSATTITMNGTNSVLTFGGVVTSAGSGTNQTLTVNGVGNTLVTGGYNLSNGSTTKNLTASGTGNVTITGIVADNSTGVGSTLTYGGTGKLTLSGANTFTGLTTVNSGGTINYQNGTAFGTNSAITVANGGTAQVQGNIAGGSQLLKIAGTGVGSAGALQNVSGNNTYAGSVQMTASSTIAVDAGSLTLSGNFVSSSSALTKTGAGTLVLAGNNPYSGGTTVSAGTLLANNATASTGTGIVNVNGGTLGGTGKITTTAGAGVTAVNIASGATLNPGDGLTAGHLTLALGNPTSKANLANGSTLVFDLGANTASSDELLVTGGLLVLNNKSFSDFTFNPLTTLTNGTTYTLMNDPLGISGTLGTTTGLFGGGLYSGTLILTATDLQLQIAVVPEPGTWAMLLGGVALLVVVRRRGARQA